MNKMTGLAAALATLAASCIGAEASPQCGPRQEVVEALGQKFHEDRKAIGLAAGRQAIVELFVSAQGTWTLSLTDTKGLTCIVGAGEDWQNTPKTLAGLDS